MDVSYYHPPLLQQFEAGVAVDVNKHPDVAAFFANVTPATHPPLMDILGDPGKYTLPDWHLNLTVLQNRQPEVTRTMTVSGFKTQNAMLPCCCPLACGARLLCVW